MEAKKTVFFGILTTIGAIIMYVGLGGYMICTALTQPSNQFVLCGQIGLAIALVGIVGLIFREG